MLDNEEDGNVPTSLGRSPLLIVIVDSGGAWPDSSAMPSDAKVRDEKQRTYMCVSDRLPTTRLTKAGPRKLAGTLEISGSVANCGQVAYTSKPTKRAALLFSLV